MWRNKLSHNWQAKGLYILTLNIYLFISLISINDDDTVLEWKFNGLDAEQSNDQLNYLIPYFYFQLSNYSSLEGVLYCKPHFEQLFKETGSFNKSFQSRKLLTYVGLYFFWFLVLLVSFFLFYLFLSVWLDMHFTSFDSCKVGWEINPRTGNLILKPYNLSVISI